MPIFRDRQVAGRIPEFRAFAREIVARYRQRSQADRTPLPPPIVSEASVTSDNSFYAHLHRMDGLDIFLHMMITQEKNAGEVFVDGSVNRGRGEMLSWVFAFLAADDCSLGDKQLLIEKIKPELRRKRNMTRLGVLASLVIESFAERVGEISASPQARRHIARLFETTSDTSTNNGARKRVYNQIPPAVLFEAVVGAVCNSEQPADVRLLIVLDFFEKVANREIAIGELFPQSASYRGRIHAVDMLRGIPQRK